MCLIRNNVTKTDDKNLLLFCTHAGRDIDLLRLFSGLFMIASIQDHTIHSLVHTLLLKPIPSTSSLFLLIPLHQKISNYGPYN